MISEVIQGGVKTLNLMKFTPVGVVFLWGLESDMQKFVPPACPDDTYNLFASARS